MEFPQYLEIKFLEWQHQQGGRKTITEFAEYLGVAQTTASAYMNGKSVPNGDKLRNIASKLGLEVYDILNLPRPDEDLHYIQQNWDNFTPAQRKAIRQASEEYKAKKKK